MQGSKQQGGNKPRMLRMAKELERLQFNAPHGITVWGREDSITELEANIQGPEDSPYAGGNFKLEVLIPERYPFEPPKVRFLTEIYHPNIDDGGRICLDVLKMPPKGSWKPSQNVATVLTSIYLLMMEPNPEDPLMIEIAKEFKEDRTSFDHKARALTQKVKIAKKSSAPGAAPEDDPVPSPKRAKTA
eukprot:TRINITY_DN5453_c0_g1_i3.p1 TRINITY_DN5453_c0_g1~~TRINITY_DN5453_c0_g1_i3.p1  ORF type:complete len:188 (-),score=36.37 TRINITY_DN5453_c0_g1_i3:356-919(-)